MTEREQKLIFGEMRRLMAEEREKSLMDMRREMKRMYQEFHDLLTGVGILSPGEDLMTREQVMKYFRIGKTKLHEMMTDGRLPFIKNGTSKQSRVLFRPADVMEAFATETR